MAELLHPLEDDPWWTGAFCLEGPESDSSPFYAPCYWCTETQKLQFRFFFFHVYLRLSGFSIEFLHATKVCKRTAPGLGTGTSPVYITHLIWDVSTATGVLNFPSLKISLIADTLYAQTADFWDKLLETQNNKFRWNSNNTLRQVRISWVSTKY